MSIPKLITSGVIAQELGEPIHRVLRVLRTRTYIRPLARAGILRLYDREAVAMVRHELTAIDAQRSKRAVLREHRRRRVPTSKREE